MNVALSSIDGSARQYLKRDSCQATTQEHNPTKDFRVPLRV
jgi:hypothetical protein